MSENEVRSALSEDEERTRVLQLRAQKENDLKHFSPEVKDAITDLIDEMVVKIVFEQHMLLKIGVADPKQYIQQSQTSEDPSLLRMTNELNIAKVNRDIECPKCFGLVKCLGLSKHLAVCMNPNQSSYSFSSRNSSRIARQRIQEGFKTSSDDTKNDGDDEQIKAKKRGNKGRKLKEAKK